MEFIKKIREELGCNHYQMAQKMGLSQQSNYAAFEKSTEKGSYVNIVKLWRLSGLSGKAFMERMEAEVMGDVDKE